MAFNFGGMMRGLGAGMVGYGEILKENEKRNWESEQSRLRELRAENLAKLQMQNQKDLAGMQIDATKEEGAATRKQQADQFKTTSEFEGRRVGIAEQEAKANAAERAANAAYRSSSFELQKQAANKKSDQMQMFEKNQEALDRWALDKAGGDKDKAQKIKDTLVVATATGLNKREEERKPPAELIQFADEKTAKAAEKLPNSTIKKIQVNYFNQTGEKISKEEARSYWSVEQTKTYLKSFGYDLDKNPDGDNMLFDVLGGKTSSTETTNRVPTKVERNPENAIKAFGSSYNPEEPPSLLNMTDAMKGEAYSKGSQEEKAAIEQAYGKSAIQRWLNAGKTQYIK